MEKLVYVTAALTPPPFIHFPPACTCFVSLYNTPVDPAGWGRGYSCMGRGDLQHSLLPIHSFSPRLQNTKILTCFLSLYKTPTDPAGWGQGIQLYG